MARRRATVEGSPDEVVDPLLSQDREATPSTQSTEDMTFPPHIKGLIFDCDGTLADTMPLHWRAWQLIAVRHELHFPEDRFYSLGGVPSRDILKMLAEEQGRPLDYIAVAHEKEEAYLPMLPRVRRHRPRTAGYPLRRHGRGGCAHDAPVRVGVYAAGVRGLFEPHGLQEPDVALGPLRDGGLRSGQRHETGAAAAHPLSAATTSSTRSMSAGLT